MHKFKGRKRLYLLLIFFLFLVFLLSSKYSRRENLEVNDPENVALKKPEEFVLAVVVCGLRREEALVMVKSALVFKSSMHLKLIVITEDSLRKSFQEKLSDWVTLSNETFSFEIHPVSFPSTNKNEWRQLFKLCAAQRLFFPDLLPHIDSLLYVDTDTLFLTPLSNIWEHFSLMNSTQFAALAPEHEDPNVGWYNRFAQHPFYGKLGVNSGVMLMNLTRMRSMGWTKYLAPIYQEFKQRLTWGDQDIINIIFHYHPECLYVYPCSYNYRPDHCMYTSVCEDAEKNGVNVLHGSRSSFQTNKQPAFKAIYQAFSEYQLGSDPYQNLLLPLSRYLDATSNTNCGQVRHVFTKIMKNFIPQKFPFR